MATLIELATWHADSDAALDAMSPGARPVPGITTVVPGSSYDLRLRVKNRSLLYTARNITLTVEGSSAGHFFLSADGQYFTDTLSLGDLGPLALTPVLVMRRVTPTATPLGTHTATLRFQASAWAAALQ